jgi:hypothetical protein
VACRHNARRPQAPGAVLRLQTEYAKLNVDDLISSPRDALDTVRAYADLGFDRLLFHPAVASLDQVDRSADAVL